MTLATTNHTKRFAKKDDIFARFRSSSSGTIDERTDVIVCNADQVHLFVLQELRRYENLKGPFMQLNWKPRV